MYISIRDEAGDLEALTRVPLWPSLLLDKVEPWQLPNGGLFL